MDYSALAKRIRSELLVTQTELADMLGVTFATVNRWKRGHHEPTIRQKSALRDLCKKHKEEIEAMVGQPLIWDRKTKKASWIAAKFPGLNFDGQSNCEKLINKSLDLLLKMQKAFKPYLLK